MTQKELFGIDPITTAQKVLSGRWALVVMQQLHQAGTLRFGQLQRALPDLTQATLTKQLRSLEDYGLVRRSLRAQAPLQMEYTLTEVGRAFGKVLNSLEAWGNDYIESQGRGELAPCL